MLLDDRNTYAGKLSIKEGLVAFKLNDYKISENWKKQFTKENYYSIIWSGSNAYKHEVNGKMLIIPKNHFLYLGPDVPQQFVHQDANVDAYYILFKEEFYSKSIEENLRLENSKLFSIDYIGAIKNNICSAPLFFSNFIKYFINSCENNFINELTHNLLERILLNGKIELNDIEDKTIHDDYDVEIANKFKKILQKNVNDNRQVTFYIDQLFVTKRRLDKATQLVFNKSAKQMITDELMRNAKIMLVNTSMSVKEIAFDLGFFQETNFTAFFKKNMGISPTKFRQNAPV